MLEFRILERVKEGREFSLHSFDNFNSCYLKLIDLINSRPQKFYVHNDFFDNIYDSSYAVYHYKIECRNVSEFFSYDVLTSNSFCDKKAL